MAFDRKTFFDGYRKAFGSVDADIVAPLEFLLGKFESSASWNDVRHVAYALATIKHETAGTFQPIKEYRSRVGSKGRANQDRYWLSGYYGRGYVQLTWERNYRKMAEVLGLPRLVDRPDLALDPNVAFDILTAGMHRGLFTGKKLTDHIKAQYKDYRNARKIINGLDKADLIAGYAKQFEKILRDSAAESAHNPLLEPAAPGPGNTETSIAPNNIPQPNIISETKTTEVVVADDAGKTVAVEETVTTPKGDPPHAPPTKVTTNGPLAKWLFSGGGVLSIATGLWGMLSTNLTSGGAIVVVCVCIIVIALLILALIFRGAITDAIRMQTAADPDKNNVT